jgi:hypothetical protein
MNSMKPWLKQHIDYVAWSIFAITTALAVWSWTQLGVRFNDPYRLFPLFGLVGFSTMWGHYVVWTLRTYSNADAIKTKLYSTFTHYLVLVCILLHPAVIIYKLYADGHGLPPASYKFYVAPQMVAFVLLGTVSLFAFLAFELKTYLSHKKTIWKIILALNHAAMLGIVIHAYKVGNTIHLAPLKYVWPLYGLALVGIYIYLGTQKKLFV